MTLAKRTTSAASKVLMQKLCQHEEISQNIVIK
jgi:hypothetical protein